MATVIKKGNLFQHARESGKKVAFKKTAKKRAPARKAVKKNPVPAAPRRQYAIEVRKTDTGKWTSVGLGGHNLEAVKRVARLYASNYPSYAFRVV